MEEKIGIENLKEVGVDLAKFAVKVEEALEDKKLNLAEAVSLGVFAIPKVLNHAGEAEALKAEIKDMDAGELNELIDFIAVELDLENDSVEAVIEAVLQWLGATNNVVAAVKKSRAKEEIG